MLSVISLTQTTHLCTIRATMNTNMIKITLNKALQAKGRTVYWLAQNSGVPHVTLWKLSKAETQNSINLPVLSRICAALECKPGDLLEYTPDAEDEAIVSLIKSKTAKKVDAGKRPAKKGGAGR